MIRLFDIENEAVIPTEHCYTLPFLKRIMDEYPDSYLKVYCYIFYMTCPNPDLNPYFNTPGSDKDELIMRHLESDFMSDDDAIKIAVENCRVMYDTPTSRAYRGIAAALDKLGAYLETTEVSAGRDGNIMAIQSVAKNFEEIRASFKGAYKDLVEEQKSHVRGGAGLAYDQR